MNDDILFYKLAEPFGVFSNFYRMPFIFDDRRWPTSEHAFQAMKFLDRENQELIRAAPTPRAAADLGRDTSRPLRKDWEQVKDSVMYYVCLAKFSQNDNAREQLLATGDRFIFEHTTKDSYWGDGGDGSGRNMLGKVLMAVRTTLRKEIS